MIPRWPGVFGWALLAGCRGCGGGPDTAAGDSSPAGETAAETGASASGCAAADNPGPLDGDLCVDLAPCRWTGEQGYGYLGQALAAGDLDGDGRADVAVGAAEEDHDGVVTAGQVRLVSGAALDGPGDGVVALLGGAGEDDGFGGALAVVGDATGDGVADLLVGAAGLDADGHADAGGAWLIPGGAWSGEGTVDPAAALVGEGDAAWVGHAVAGAGDFDGDGLADLLLSGELGAVKGDETAWTSGRVYVVAGAPDFGGGPVDEAALAAWDGSGDEAAGRALAGGADLDGDGYADVLVGAPYADGRAGAVYVLFGSASPTGGALARASALHGEAESDLLGWKVAVGELSGDGAADLVVAAPTADRAYDGAGRVDLYLGGPGLRDGAFEALASFDGTFDDEQLGTGLAAGGDVDGDGQGDLLVGAVDAWKGFRTRAGRVYLWRGPIAAGSEPRPASEADAAFHGAASKDYLGGALATGDLDGDGADEVLLGSGFVNGASTWDSGAVYLFWGG